MSIARVHIYMQLLLWTFFSVFASGVCVRISLCTLLIDRRADKLGCMCLCLNDTPLCPEGRGKWSAALPAEGRGPLCGGF